MSCKNMKGILINKCTMRRHLIVYGRLEKKESTLKQMFSTVKKDKKKIEDTIVSLEEYKRVALVKTWNQVNK